ncbi:unnamed protein product [Sphenostylis stenocarpa]|uniref:Uncharacterized protein n=1 Tax=Sphenostylis stenocarpa TaxID=92480 RepID=A0AA86VII5_9FABA|nr:unnamed protein product [Sphenostylis stenocarpa]
MRLRTTTEPWSQLAPSRSLRVLSTLLYRTTSDQKEGCLNAPPCESLANVKPVEEIKSLSRIWGGNQNQGHSFVGKPVVEFIILDIDCSCLGYGLNNVYLVVVKLGFSVNRGLIKKGLQIGLGCAITMLFGSCGGLIRLNDVTYFNLR